VLDDPALAVEAKDVDPLTAVPHELIRSFLGRLPRSDAFYAELGL